MSFSTLEEIQAVIKRSGVTECEDRNCEGCEFAEHSPEYVEVGSTNVCGLLNEIYNTK